MMKFPTPAHALINIDIIVSVPPVFHLYIIPVSARQCEFRIHRQIEAHLVRRPSRAVFAHDPARIIIKVRDNVREHKQDQKNNDQGHGADCRSHLQERPPDRAVYTLCEII